MPQTILTNVGGRVSKEPVPSGGGAWRLLTFMIFVLAVFLLSYFGLIFGYKNFVEAQIIKKDQELEELANQVPKEEQEEFLKFQYQIINLQSLLNKHVIASKVLPLIEANTNSQVYFSGFDIGVSAGRLNLQAVVPSYDVLAQQLAVFERLPAVMRYQISNARTAEGGRVQFDVSLFLKPEVFR